jgi:hypothetical protein
MKAYYFLTGLPRSGNTLLGSIINQNPYLNLTANTILTDALYQLHLLKDYPCLLYNEITLCFEKNNIIYSIKHDTDFKLLFDPSILEYNIINLFVI